MKKIPLGGIFGKEKFALVDDEDFKRVNQFKWHLNTRGAVVFGKYVRGSGRKNQKTAWTVLHRFILNAFPKQIIDHINGNPLDNRKINLRFCTPQQNNMNRGAQKNNKSGYKGVSFFKGAGWKLKKPWIAHIMLNQKNIHLGYFSTKEEAAKAYNKAALQYFGEFAKLNKII